MDLIPNPTRFERTDVWREGEWLDLWSVVHFLSGLSVGFGLYVLHFSPFASTLLAFLFFVFYEMWEMLVQIQETPANRFMDVVVGMVSFLLAFFVLAPPLSSVLLIFAFGFALAANIVMSVFGWRASQKAAELKKRMLARYAAQRALLLGQKEKMRKRFRRHR
jgi:hypothetical protein